jgi:hypothetical protein
MELVLGDDEHDGAPPHVTVDLDGGRARPRTGHAARCQAASRLLG